tara:strand:- start:1089 stop:1889 length:801 start_codon:yes stop_codon:yes gene_type:complete
MKLNIGITGYTGSLGKIIRKNKSRHNYFYYKDDIQNKKKLLQWFKKNNLNVIFHLAAIVPIKVVNKNKKKAYKVNYLGTKNLVTISKKFDLKWFFFASTSHVYRSYKKPIKENFSKFPISYYGKTKLISEKYIQKNIKNYCIGRIFSTSNKNQRKNYLIPDLKDKIKKVKKKIVLENLNHYRDFISMKDITKVIHILLEKKFIGVINIGSGKGIYLKDIAKIILKKYKKTGLFIDNKKKTYLIANNQKLKKITRLKFNTNIKNMIF